MTRARYLAIRAALFDIKGWLRDVSDALVCLSMILVAGIALLNVGRALL